MKSKILIVILTMFILLFTYNNSSGSEMEILENNINSKDIKIDILDIDILNESIKINDFYNASAIITMRVYNKSIKDIELSNIDVYPYQGSKETKYFVSTCDKDIHGFIGNLKPKENKIIKMGVTLHNITDNIKLEFLNIEDKNNDKIIETINIK